MLRRSHSLSLAIVLIAAPALAGPQWVELGDAGNSLATANAVVGTGPSLTAISGTLMGPARGVGGPDLADMYIFRVVEPMIFTATTVPGQGGSSEFDSSLWLFRIGGGIPEQATGLLANRDAQPGSTVASRLGNAATDETGAVLLAPGRYALAITGGDHVPVSNGGQIFFFETPGEVSGPDGPGGSQPQVNFLGDGESGDYTIILGGSAPLPPPAVPAVSDVGLVILAMLLLCGGVMIFNRRAAAAADA